MSNTEEEIVENRFNCKICKYRDEQMRKTEFIYSAHSEEERNHIAEELLTGKSFSEIKRFRSALNLHCLRKLYNMLGIYGSYMEEKDFEDEFVIGIFSERADELVDEFHLNELEDWDIIYFLLFQFHGVLFDRFECHENSEPCSEETNCKTFEQSRLFLPWLTRQLGIHV